MTNTWKSWLLSFAGNWTRPRIVKLATGPLSCQWKMTTWNWLQRVNWFCNSSFLWLLSASSMSCKCANLFLAVLSLIRTWAVCCKIESCDPMWKVLACAGGNWRFVTFLLLTLVWPLDIVSVVGGSISNKLTWFLPEHLKQLIFDQQSLAGWLFLRHFFLAILLVTTWQLGVAFED